MLLLLVGVGVVCVVGVGVVCVVGVGVVCVVVVGVEWSHHPKRIIIVRWADLSVFFFVDFRL